MNGSTPVLHSLVFHTTSWVQLLSPLSNSGVQTTNLPPPQRHWVSVSLDTLVPVKYLPDVGRVPLGNLSLDLHPPIKRSH